jgi:hydroxyacylglutathione hydrolase
VTPEALRARLKARQDAPAVLDVRARDEWESGHIEGAVNIPLAELSSRLDEVPSGPLVAMCGSGYRSSIACSLLQRAGRRQVANLAGGWIAWEESSGI